MHGRTREAAVGLTLERESGRAGRSAEKEVAAAGGGSGKRAKGVPLIPRYNAHITFPSP